MLLSHCNADAGMADASEEENARQLGLARQRRLEHQRRIEHVRACSAARFDVKTARKDAAAAEAAIEAVKQVRCRPA